MLRDGVPVPRGAVPGLWQTDAAFADCLTGAIQAAPYRFLRWETPPLADATAALDFEFVLLDAPELAAVADPVPFEARFRAAAGAGVTSFPNLGGDALLVVPCPGAAGVDHADLASFLRTAPRDRARALWAAAGVAAETRRGPAPIWVSAAGGGVAWLHVRIDKRPKYYGYAPYRTLPAAAPRQRP